MSSRPDDANLKDSESQSDRTEGDRRSAAKSAFSSIGQQVQDLDINDKDDGDTVEEDEDAPDEYRWKEEKVVETIESLCMNCQQDVSTTSMSSNLENRLCSK